MQKIFLVAASLLLMLTTACSTTFVRPFADPADAALTEKVLEAIAAYPDVGATAVGGRVYLEGWVLGSTERFAILSIVQAIPGVTNIADSMKAIAERGGGRN